MRTGEQLNRHPEDQSISTRDVEGDNTHVKLQRPSAYRVKRKNRRPGQRRGFIVKLEPIPIVGVMRGSPFHSVYFVHYRGQ